MTGDQAALAGVQGPNARAAHTSATSTDEGDDSLGPISPTLPSSGSTNKKDASVSQATNRDSDGEEREMMETKDVPAMNADERKANLRSRTATGGDRMETDD